jgi:two-component system cell cycle sensor histidine kinase/response regulator CckA
MRGAATERILVEPSMAGVERDAAEERQRYRELFEFAPDGYLVTDIAGIILEANRTIGDMIEIPAGSLVGRDLAGFVDEVDREDFVQRLRLLGGESPEPVRDWELWLRASGDRSFPVSVNGVVSRDASGRQVGVRWTVRDITQRKIRENNLLAAQKMEAAGRLAGGVAHTFNNLLTAILGHAERIRRRLGPGHPLEGEAAQIQRAGELAASLTKQLLAFARKEILQPGILDLNAVIEGLKPILSRLIGENVALRTVLEPDLGQVLVDAAQIQQILIHLAVNAAEAMPGGGQLAIETANVELDEGYAAGRKEVAPGSYVRLAVADTGTGMDESTRDRLFEPFFTTKRAGTGLGLASVYGAVKQSGGHITVYSEPGQGSTFKIYLPRVARGSGEPAPAAFASAAPARGGSETILLVEDDALVSSLARDELEERGYAVLAAGSAEEGLGLSASIRGKIHLLLTDIVLPGMNGKELYGRARALQPDLRVLYVSGYTVDAIVHKGVLEKGTAFLAKPFTPDALCAKVREVLDAPPAPPPG